MRTYKDTKVLTTSLSLTILVSSQRGQGSPTETKHSSPTYTLM